MLPDGISESSHACSVIAPVPKPIDAAERVLAVIQRRQCPLGSVIIAISVNNSIEQFRMTYIERDQHSDNDCVFDTQVLA